MEGRHKCDWSSCREGCTKVTRIIKLKIVSTFFTRFTVINDNIKVSVCHMSSSVLYSFFLFSSLIEYVTIKSSQRIVMFIAVMSLVNDNNVDKLKSSTHQIITAF